jgi:HK97 family phage portal protein
MFRPRGAYDDRSPYGRFWFEPIGMRSSAGVRVSSETAMRLGAVFRCVSVLANTFPVLPFCLFEPQKDGTRVPRKDHWLYKLISRRPNQYQNPFEWRQMCMGHIALRGNAYNRLYSNGRGQVTDLIPLHPDRVKVDLLPNGNYRYIVKQQNGEDEIVPRGQMWHLRGLSQDGYVGMSPIAYARDAIGRGLAAQEYGAMYFRNSGAPTGGWIEHPGKFKQQSDRDNFREAWQNARTGEGRHKTPVLEDGMKFHELGIKNDEAQFVDTMEFSVTDICRFFGVPPHLAYDLRRSTFSNIEQQSLEFVIYTMTPIAEMWEASIEYEFLADEDTLDTEFDMRRMMRGDLTARTNFYRGMWNMGSYSPNDILLKEGENPVEGGDQRFVPVNMTPLRPNMGPSPATSRGNSPSDDSSDDEDEAKPPEPARKRDRNSALAQAAAERIARREVAVISKAIKQSPDALDIAYASHAKFVSEALAIDIATAMDYCAMRRASLTPDTDTTDYEMASRCLLERLAAEGSL